MDDPTQLPMEFTSGSQSYDAHAVSRGQAMRVAKLSQETRKEASRGFGGKLWSPDRGQAPPERREKKVKVLQVAEHARVGSSVCL